MKRSRDIRMYALVLLIILLPLNILIGSSSEFVTWALSAALLTAIFYLMVSLSNGATLYEKLDRYAKTHNLSPEELAKITGYSPYDFSLDSSGRMIFMRGWYKDRRKVLLALEAKFGKIDWFLVHNAPISIVTPSFSAKMSQIQDLF